MARLGDVFILIRNGASIKQTEGAGGLPITRIETISNRQVDRNKFGYAGIQEIQKFRDYILQNDDILMSHINSEKHLGKAALYKKEGDEQIIHGMNLLLLRANVHAIWPKYAFYYFETPFFRGQISKITKKSVNQASFTVTALKEVDIPLPSLETQKSIADRLDRLDRLMFLRKQQLAKLDELVKVRFVEMFGDPVNNTFCWDTCTLDECCNGIGDGLHGTPDYDENGSYPFINGNNLLDGTIVVTKTTKMVNLSEYKRLYINIGENAILISINGTLGKMAFYNGEKIVLGKSACYCNIKGSINRVFVYGVMSSDSFKDFLESSATKSTIKNVGLKAIREYQMILPPLELQQRFAKFFINVNIFKLTIQQSLDTLEVLKKSLMQQYFG